MSRSRKQELRVRVIEDNNIIETRFKPDSKIELFFYIGLCSLIFFMIFDGIYPEYLFSFYFTLVFYVIFIFIYCVHLMSSTVLVLDKKEKNVEIYDQILGVNHVIIKRPIEDLEAFRIDDGFVWLRLKNGKSISVPRTTLLGHGRFDKYQVTPDSNEAQHLVAKLNKMLKVKMDDQDDIEQIHA